MTAPAVRPLFALQQQRPEIFSLMEKMAGIMVGRAQGYATQEDPYRNFRRCAGAGVDPATGVFIRMGDKFSRVENLIRQGKTEATDGEKIEDNLLDLANYSLICLALLQKDHEQAQRTVAFDAALAGEVSRAVEADRDALAEAFRKQSQNKRQVWNKSRPFAPRTNHGSPIPETNIPGFMLEPGEVIEATDTVTDEDMDENELRLFIAQAQAAVAEKVRAFSANSEPGDVAAITIELKNAGPADGDFMTHLGGKFAEMLKNEGPDTQPESTEDLSGFRADIRKKFAEILGRDALAREMAKAGPTHGNPAILARAQEREDRAEFHGWVDQVLDEMVPGTEKQITVTRKANQYEQPAVVGDTHHSPFGSGPVAIFTRGDYETGA